MMMLVLINDNNGNGSACDTRSCGIAVLYLLTVLAMVVIIVVVGSDMAIMTIRNCIACDNCNDGDNGATASVIQYEATCP